ncbi:AAA family ATPase [Sphingomonas qomolangmaensis]|uniref:AAA family ATPase n=1 Tax=Sphingomonas qomolangmaensis TaxID=2918765 RepID=A0ABY5LDH7_9SPHN|nr:AAA family ATPase [Sphingomonas qomolangmaensis]UUL83774.1 AAA family ATPase [Sphingomonas qomolangmaensis]
MRLRYVHLHGFRGYRKPVRIDFAESFTIIDGRNGVGKSTIFDAVEFALTGTISKYLDAKADGESVTDYIWWTGPYGQEDDLSDHFVEVGFGEESASFEIRRTPLDPTSLDVRSRAEKLYLPNAAPREAIAQLCNSTIIRDEHIARLSLDLKEGERFRLLRDAIGAVDADDWIRRAQAIHSAAATKLKTAQSDAEAATVAQAVAVRQIDEAQASLPADDLVGQASERLRRALDTTATGAALAELARQRLADIASAIGKLQPLIDGFAGYEAARTALPASEERASDASVSETLAQMNYDESVAALGAATRATMLSAQARQLENLVEIGRTLGLRDGHCPLCASDVSHEAFHRGLDHAMSIARTLDAQAVEQARKERERDTALTALQAAEREAVSANTESGQLADAVSGFEGLLAESHLAGASRIDIEHRLSGLLRDQQSIAADMPMLDTLLFDRVISRATSDQATAAERVRQTELRLGRARLGETRSKALYDAARRASAETLQQRLDRVIPLMSELYRRLRPHPLWGDIEYSVRGDVNRFLTLKVEGNVNPQFVFSSGQRRATGLAFLLSVNLSIAWSRWQSILLDDPVQHVDDFRTVHLAEVLAQLCSSGRQIVCAVEDRALADLMCRRLPSSVASPGKRISLGTDASGALAVVHEQTIATLSRRSLVLPEEPLSA